MITILKLIPLNNQSLISASLDFNFKIWGYPDKNNILNSLNEPLCIINLKHPLPTIWNLKIDDKLNMEKKILFAMKSL